MSGGSSWKLLGEACCGQGHGRDGQWCPKLAPQLSFRSPLAACAATLSKGSGARCPGSASPLSSNLPLQREGFRATVAQRLVRMLQICAGHVPGVSALNLLSLLRSSENPAPEDL